MTYRASLERIASLEKLLELELASADLMDILLLEWAQNMRGMARHNIALDNVLREILDYCDESGIKLNGLYEKASLILI